MSQQEVLDLLTRAKYTGLDFDTHLDDLKSRLQIKFAADFNDFGTSSLGIMLMEVISYGLETLSFYLDRRATDTFISTARTRRSVARLARQLGYKMGSAIAASGDLQVVVKNPQAFEIPLPQGFQFKGPKGLIYEAAEEVTFAAGSADPRVVPVYQGVTKSESFVSDGTANQVFELSRISSGSFIAGGTVKVVVDGVAYEEQEFLDFTDTEQFEVGYNDDPPTIRFGDGSVGKIPPTAATIAVQYVVSQGKAGQVNRETITEVNQPLVVSFTRILLSVNNPAAMVGGDDYEDLEHAKAYAPRVWKSRKVAVTREDYEALAGAFADPLFGRVAVAQAISPRSAAEDLALNNYLQGIRGLTGDPVPIVQADLATIEGVLTEVGEDLDDIGTELVLATGSVLAAHSTDCGTAINSFRGVRNTIQEVSADKDTIDTTASDARALVDGIGVAGASALTAGDKASLQGWLDTIRSEATSIAGHVATVESLASGGVSVIGQLRGRLEDVGLDLVTSGTNLYKIEQLRQGVSSAVGTADPQSGLFVLTQNIADTVVDNSVAIEGYLDSLYEHLDGILSADCKANLVTVPILTKDVDGFYAPPSLGLIKSLQSHLKQRCEVTQSVEVVSGELYLAPAVLTVDVSVYPGYVQAVTEAAVLAVVENLLKGRLFGQSLYRAIVIQAVLKVAGVGWCNVRIEGCYQTPLTSPPILLVDKVDADGNLILGVGDVLTKGKITVTSRQLTYLESGSLIPKLP